MAKVLRGSRVAVGRWMLIRGSGISIRCNCRRSPIQITLLRIWAEFLTLVTAPSRVRYRFWLRSMKRRISRLKLIAAFIRSPL